MGSVKVVDIMKSEYNKKSVLSILISFAASLAGHAGFSSMSLLTINGSKKIDILKIKI